MFAKLDRAVDQISDFVDSLAYNFPVPVMVRLGPGTAYRHRDGERTAQLACYLKAIKVCTTLRGAVVLAREGLVTEAYALCRISDEMGTDILFLSEPRGEAGSYSNIQQRFLTEFYQEEFDNADDPLNSTQKRDRVPRQKIHAATFKGIADPSTAIAASGTMYSGFSGYVHGAYGHIVEVYGGFPPKYYLKGVAGTPVIPAAIKTVCNFVLRGSMAVEVVAGHTGDITVLQRARSLSTAIQQALQVAV